MVVTPPGSDELRGWWEFVVGAVDPSAGVEGGVECAELGMLVAAEGAADEKGARGGMLVTGEGAAGCKGAWGGMLLLIDATGGGVV